MQCRRGLDSISFPSRSIDFSSVRERSPRDSIVAQCPRNGEVRAQFRPWREGISFRVASNDRSERERNFRPMPQLQRSKRVQHPRELWETPQPHPRCVFPILVKNKGIPAFSGQSSRGRRHLFQRLRRLQASGWLSWPLAGVVRQFPESRKAVRRTISRVPFGPEAGAVRRLRERPAIDAARFDEGR